MDEIILKKPLSFYQKRFNRFLWLMVAVKGLEPQDQHLWQVMDGVAFQDTETALETALHNEGESLDIKTAERLTLAIRQEEPRRSASTPSRRTANE